MVKSLKSPKNLKHCYNCIFRAVIVGCLLFVSIINHAQAQRRNSAYESYINEYKDLAIEQMNRYRIPASITLAQGLLESRAGQSQLARKANNHFGIKCSGNWSGPYYVQDDDYRNERFRVYQNVRESFEDHSIFLQKKRYAPLFQLDAKDYKGWAHGLKAAGYATNPRYGNILINIIETYNLSQYDSKPKDKESIFVARQDINSSLEHRVFYNNKNYYIVARSGDTFESISKEMGVSRRKLMRYNELDKHYTIKSGDIIYMEKKQTRADKKYKKNPHVVVAGESYYSIAQKYGIRLKSVYKLNNITPDHSIRVGEILRIR